MLRAHGHGDLGSAYVTERAQCVDDGPGECHLLTRLQADETRLLVGLAPFVKAVGHDEAPPLLKRGAEGGFSVDRLDAGIDTRGRFWHPWPSLGLDPTWP